MRGAIVLAALYAFALQGILGGALAADFSGPIHRPCLMAAGTAPDGSGPPSPERPPVPCCIAAPLPHPAPVPPAPETGAVWPARRVVGLAWRAEVVVIPRGPPGAVPRARGPPAA